MTSTLASEARARVLGVNGDTVTIGLLDGEFVKNEVVHVIVGSERLKGEVLRIRGREADIQVFEETRGVRVGDAVDLSGELLSVTLGPGLLGTIYDGLQSPLDKLAIENGFFLPRGVAMPALDPARRWSFVPAVRTGARLRAGDTLGTVQEGRFLHRIMVPFDEPGEVEVTFIQEGNFTVVEPVARVRRGEGRPSEVTLSQTWPVRRPLASRLVATRRCERVYPTQPLTTTIRLIDTFFPIARGGTGCIPGPFGAGKTVLQGLIARYSSADIVVIVACGERAGEVVETLTDFPKMKDPVTGGSLMERTIIICNTSSMPVAAREASIYTGITLGEYYRQMGYNVLLLADSTSRWAQAMRETSGRLEEIPGEEAFPAYLDSSIKSVYERAGVIRAHDGREGSLTMIGTVSPAGGNFEEPVTQSTLATVKTFLGLSYDRAYKRFYPAVDPLISWSRYLEQLRPWAEKENGAGWTEGVERMLELLQKGDSIYQMMQVTGEEGIPLADFVVWQKAVFVDMVFLQQDAYDAVDVSTPPDRQREVFAMLRQLVGREYRFDSREEAREFFTRLTGLFKNLNYSRRDSNEYARYAQQIKDLADSHS